MNRSLRYTLIASTTLMLNACAGIAHDTPEARQQIQQDLKLQNIVATSIMSYCQIPLGGEAWCRATPGIGVITADRLIMVDYVNGHYRQDDVLTSKDIRCIAESDGHRFQAFTTNRSVTVFPYKEGTDANSVFREQAIALLLADGQPYLTGTAGHFVRETDRERTNVTSVNYNGTTMYLPYSTKIMEIYSPCLPESNRAD
ncbi:hypothetical protein CSV86_011340 [Pseudomonas putida CSV86]|uniref:Uncharacterized protein n=1 Tax=Pseudomonas bharatica CSV86 TaxID=1005395 RepID=L1LUI5_9PSED|nr:hypothetical protein [Pseudomonas bharatica]NNJ15786.1 hypothetical protein [Pseudomonas bharatica CSV86]